MFISVPNIVLVRLAFAKKHFILKFLRNSKTDIIQRVLLFSLMEVMMLYQPVSLPSVEPHFVITLQNILITVKQCSSKILLYCCEALESISFIIASSFCRYWNALLHIVLLMIHNSLSDWLYWHFLHKGSMTGLGWSRTNCLDETESLKWKWWWHVGIFGRYHWFKQAQSYCFSFFNI